VTRRRQSEQSRPRPPLICDEIEMVEGDGDETTPEWVKKRIRESNLQAAELWQFECLHCRDTKALYDVAMPDGTIIPIMDCICSIR
jgi:hypothetical protein